MSEQTSQPLLRVRDLVVEIPTRRGVLRPVNGVSFDVERGEILGVVGESGAGKSITGAAIIGLLDSPSRIASGEVWLDGQRIDNLDLDGIRRVRGRQIGTIFQDPLTSLNPLLPIGEQLAETAMVHLSITRAEARERALAALIEVGIPAAAQRIDAYAHEFSGGMRQRVVIALALIAEPRFVIADEPTTALDVSVQAQILSLLRSLCVKRNTGVMLITHDMGVIAETTDRVAVLYAGRLAEIGPTKDVVESPGHPYSRGLMAATPTPSALTDKNERLNQIPGSMPGLMDVPSGCAFHPRCECAEDRCRTEVPSSRPSGNSHSACYLHSEEVSP